MALASMAAGVLHLTAAPAHSHHEQVLAFFIGSGIAQIVFGTAVLTPRPSRWFLRLGALGNITLVAVWFASRLSGLPFVEGADHAEPVGVKDTVTVLFELFVVAGAIALASDPPALRMRLRLSERALAPLAVATALLIVPGLTSPAHEHSDDHMHGGETGHSHEILAAGHAHTDGAADHAHDAVDAGHPHGAESHAAMHGSGTHAHQEAPVAHAAAPATPVEIPEVTGLRSSVRYGPFMLGPAEFGGEAHYNRIRMNVRKPCENCYIVSMAPNMIYADGSPANLSTGTMLHHAVWTRPDVDDRTCRRDSAIGFMGERFFASGNERTVMSLPEGFGYWVGADRWGLIAEIMNHNQQSRTVYLTLDVVYRPAADKLKKVVPVWMDIDNCGDSQYAVPAGKSNRLWTWRSSVTGRVVSTGGHVHDGGVKTVLTNESTKQHMCSSVAGYGTKPEYRNTIESMSTCIWDRIGVVRKGEDLGIRAYYDTARPEPDVMGINIVFIYPTSDLAGGSAPPSGGQPKEQAPPQHSGGHDHP